jgi:hypothetical protein
VNARDARSIIENAEQAAAAGNYASAEDLLREAADLQEQTLGARHPDLANTFNNLGIVCEITDNPIDAEHYFRRAHAIATAALPADHPFVATSRKNLHDFCAARGRPVELPPSPPALAAWLDAPEPAPAHAPQPAPARAPEPAPTAVSVPAAAVPTPIAAAGHVPSRSLRPLLVGVSSAAVLLVILTLARPWSRPVEEITSRPAAPTTSAPAPATPVATSAATPMATPVATPTTTPAASPAEPPPRPQPTATPSPSIRSEAPTAAAAQLTVAAAQLCTALDAWKCETAEPPVQPGPLFFYTQIKSAAPATIEHRWYQGDRLRRTVQLRIEANPGTGYRTYSRSTISASNAGDWRVELRSAGGTLLHEEAFTVR